MIPSLVARGPSSLRLLLPFTFDPDDTAQLVGAVGHAGWDVGNGPQTVWTRQTPASDDLLPHVSDYLGVRDTPKSERGRPDIDLVLADGQAVSVVV